MLRSLEFRIVISLRKTDRHLERSYCRFLGRLRLAKIRRLRKLRRFIRAFQRKEVKLGQILDYDFKEMEFENELK